MITVKIMMFYCSMATGCGWLAQLPPMDLIRETEVFRRWAASWAEARSVAKTVRWASITSRTRLRHSFGAARVHVAGIVAFLGEFSGVPGGGEGAFLGGGLLGEELRGGERILDFARLRSFSFGAASDWLCHRVCRVLHFCERGWLPWKIGRYRLFL